MENLGKFQLTVMHLKSLVQLTLKARFGLQTGAQDTCVCQSCITTTCCSSLIVQQSINSAKNIINVQ